MQRLCSAYALQDTSAPMHYKTSQPDTRKRQQMMTITWENDYLPFIKRTLVLWYSEVGVNISTNAESFIDVL
jgi:hypothetical protein